MTNDQKLLAEAYKEVAGEPVIQERGHPTAARIAGLKHMLDKLQFSRSEIVINDTLDKMVNMLDKALTTVGMGGEGTYDGPSPEAKFYGENTTPTVATLCESWKRVATSENDVYDFLIWAKNTYGDKVIYNESVMDAAVKKLKL